MEQKEEGAIAAVKKGMALLDRHLAKNTYLVGHTATLADIVGVCNLYYGYTKVRFAKGQQNVPSSGTESRGPCVRPRKPIMQRWQLSMSLAVRVRHAWLCCCSASDGQHTEPGQA